MRIIGGEWGGRALKSPRGREVSRPTTDRVREACASMLESALDNGIEGVRALDAFGGTGALGIELLSRGASHVTFFDTDRGAARLIGQNLQTLRCDTSRYRVLCSDVIASARRGCMPGAPYDVVWIDPPYDLGVDPAVNLLDALVSSGSVRPGTIIVFERSATRTPSLRVDGFDVLREKRYGITAIDALRYNPGARKDESEGELA